jgi:uncharacterized protein involved in exopolysaccharide biosynthesis
MEENNIYKQDRDINDGYIGILELFKILWKGKVVIILITFLSILLSVIFALSQNDIYKSSALVSIQSANESGGSSLSQYSSLASMAGIKLPSSSSSSDKTFFIIETISSRVFFSNLIKKYNLLPDLMATESFNKELNKSIYSDSYNTNTMEWTISTPSFTKSHQVFLSILNVRQDPKNKFITIEIDHESPIFAHKLLSTIIKEINLIIRDQDLRDSELSIEYLKLKVSETKLKEVKDSFNSLIGAELEKKMLADIKEDYALKIIDPPLVPEFKFKPQRSIIVFFSFVFGFFFSILLVLFRHFLILIK